MEHVPNQPELRAACYKLMCAQGHPEPTGAATITAGFNLPAAHVIHTVGPIVHGDVTTRDRELLARCYRSCLDLAGQCSLDTLAFCCISTGEFHFPADEAARIAVETVEGFLATHMFPKKVIFDVFTPTDYDRYRALLGSGRTA